MTKHDKNSDADSFPPSMYPVVSQNYNISAHPSQTGLEEEDFVFLNVFFSDHLVACKSNGLRVI